MNAFTPITALLDAETTSIVDRLATAQGVSSGQFVAEAARRVAASERDFDAFIQVGIDAADRGELVPNDRVMTELDAMIAKHQAQCQA